MTLFCRRFAQTSVSEPRTLRLNRARGHDHAVEVLLVPGLVQQRHVHHHHRVPEQFESAKRGSNRPIHGRMHDGVEIPAGGRIREHHRPKLRAIDASVRQRARPRRSAPRWRPSPPSPPRSRRAPARRHRGRPGRGGGTARGHDSSRSQCRPSGQPSASVRPSKPDATPHVSLLPSRHPARPAPPARSTAAVSVFLSSMAIVRGPTPPGTGVSAPATSATSG